MPLRSAALEHRGAGKSPMAEVRARASDLQQPLRQYPVIFDHKDRFIPGRGVAHEAPVGIIANALLNKTELRTSYHHIPVDDPREIEIVAVQIYAVRRIAHVDPASAQLRWDRTTNRPVWGVGRSEEHTSELQSPCNLVCRLL